MIELVKETTLAFSLLDNWQFVLDESEAHTTSACKPFAAIGRQPIEAMDDRLVAAVLSGDHYAFNDLVARYVQRMWFFSRRLSPSMEESYDALQEGMIKTFNKMHLFGGQAPFQAWLQRVVANSSTDCARKILRRRPEIHLDAAEHDGDFHPHLAVLPFDDHELRMIVVQHVAKLSKEHREAIFLVDFLGYSVERAAQISHVSAGTIKSRRARARAHLSALMDADLLEQ